SASREIGLIPLQILRKAFSKKRKEYSLRGGLQKHSICAELIRPGIFSGSGDGFQILLRIGEQRQNGVRDDSDRNARSREFRNSLDTQIRAWRKWFCQAGKVPIHGSDRYGHSQLVVPSKFAKQVRIPADQVRLGSQEDRHTLHVFERFKHLPGQQKLAFRGLIRVRGGSDPNNLFRFNGLQFLLERERIPVFRVDLTLERLRIAPLQKLVCEPCITIFAAVFTTAIRVNGPIEWHAPRMAAVQPSAGRQAAVLDAALIVE